jgi:hypothetical protein
MPSWREGGKFQTFTARKPYAPITKREVYVCSLPCLLQNGWIFCSPVVLNLCTSPTPCNAQDTQPHYSLNFLLLQQSRNTHSKFTEWMLRITILYRLLWNENNRRTRFQIYSCTKLHVSGSSSTHHQELATVHSALAHVIQDLTTASVQDQDGTAVPSWFSTLTV